MPELPEVETIRRMLCPVVIGATITSVDVFYRPMIHSDLEAFKADLQGKTFFDVTRIGKFLIFHLSEGNVIVSHLRMEGRYMELKESEPNTRFSRLVFHFSDGRKLCYDDSRCFGTMELTTEAHYKKLASLTNLGPEPWDVHRVSYLYDRLKKSSRPIKQLLLDQSILSGLGNIYVDEVLFRTKLHPLTPGKLLTKKDAKRVLDASRKVLSDAIEAGGSTVRTYHAMNGIDGMFQNNLLAYGKSGQPCIRCNTPLHKMMVGGRGTTYCPHCQRNKAWPLVIGITGKIASGKSTVLALFEKEGFKGLSSDAIVHRLYQQKENVERLVKVFGPTIEKEGVVDRAALADVVRDKPTLKRKLEKLVHPWVEHVIIQEIQNSSRGDLAIEVPLLYEAHLEYLFDAVIAVSVTEKTQRKNLRTRGTKNIDQALLLNANNQFTEYVKKADYVIKNNGSMDALKQRVHEVSEKIHKEKAPKGF